MRVVRWCLFTLASTASLAVNPANAEPVRRDAVNDWSLPGLGRVGFPTAATEGVRATGAAGYGYTEAIDEADGAHHRTAGSLSVGALATTWLGFALRMDGRLDLHDEGPGGSDSSAVGEPSLLVRGGWDFTDALAAGLDIAVRLLGADAPSFEPAATTPEARALFAARPSDALHLGAYGGYRLDRSAEAASAPERLSLGDRVSLGVSDFDAVVLGLGAAQAVGSGELFGEVSYDLLVGSGAPSPAESPLRAAVGFRAFLGAFQLGGIAEAVLTGRAPIGPTDPLYVVEPRVAARAVLSYVFGAESAEPSKPADAPKPQEVRPAAAPKPATPPPLGEVRIVVTTPEGGSVTDAVVLLETPSGELTLTFDQGAYRLESPPAGPAKLIVVADGFENVERSIVIEPGKAAEATVSLEPALPHGQIRGLVRSFAGRAIRAKIVVSRLDGGDAKELSTDATGNFTVDVQPGEYRVEIGAPGYQAQKRQIVVKEKGVVILNADLHQGR
jgi:hypothetical protein